MCDAETNLLLPYRTQEALISLRGGLRLLPQELLTESTTAHAYWDAFLTAYKCICLNAATIPPKFVMPSSESVPKVAHGFLLGAAIASVRSHVLLHPAHRAALDKLGLAWSTSVPEPAAATTPKHRSYRWPEKVRALERYKALHGHCDVPVSFVVPSSRDWPQDLHGCRLGYLVSRFHSELSSIPAEYKPVIAGLTVTDASTGSSSSNPFVYDMASSNSDDDASDEEDDLDWSPPEPKRPRVSSPIDALREPEPEAATPRRTTLTDLSPPIAPPRPTIEIPQPVSEPTNDMTRKRPLSPPAKPRRAGTAIDDDAWLDVLLALKVYRLLYGHCKVPLSFFVPRLDHTPTAWPLHLTGMRLGAAVKTLRTCYLPERFVSALDAIGFVWRQDGRLIPTGTSLFDEIDAVPFAAMITALEVHVATHQTTLIPAHATFVHTSVWHRSWTYVLADVVPALEARFYQLSDVQMARLRDLGYCKQLPLWDDLMDLLQRYYEHVVPPGSGVAIDFVVPPDAIAWPSQWHGLELGLLFWSVGLTHTTTLSESRRRDLKTHKFVFNTVHTWAKVLDALTTYDSLSTKPSSFAIGRSYVTPTSAVWPAALRGYPLGQWYKVMCDAETNLLLPYRTQEALISLRGGLRLLPQELLTESTTAHAYWDAFLTAYKCICLNAATIPPKFVMPSSESVPKVAHGFLLGAAIASVRSHVLLHPAHRAALDKLGLAWSTSVPEPAATEPVEIAEWVPTPRRRNYRWPDKMRALEAFKELHGHCGVPTAFVVPSSTEWPEDLHGCRLGALVSRFFAEPRSVPADYVPLISALAVVSVPGDTIVAPTVNADGTVVNAFASSDTDTTSDSSDADATSAVDAPMDATTQDDATVTDGERFGRRHHGRCPHR
ncbi:hypothetical protein SPRG_16491 [Saprolegnia parasitica CBS 223.65]|uniref:Helicase-associated domain-containing protein n=1 Tax=Saprolegnia parasitica (strain CBS 223.65) TaxID=695850 RepID=A0A067BH81_SAPPC|nr:hypothetical protein SPRG_16491 [Saprolegnia parasitica CBS 223.65]KDO17709.1 hypothetical protein SPRG_16491 [Saprolegnia parasitica CBS 223.65]|eukprot:XP_012211584.1 hypothetical protein SPRG_16491 [Saprolegnia parasitica CBS 223.65]